MGKIILFCLTLLNMGNVWAGDDPPPGIEFPELVITYRYENFPSFPSHAQAEARTPKESKRMLGSAKVIKLKWYEIAEAKTLESLIVEETHFDDKGQVLYRARSTFSGEGQDIKEEGQKIEEEVLEGRKRLELFSWWPIGSLP